MFSALGRNLAATTLCVGLVVAASACGDNEDSGASSNTVTIKPSTYAVRPPVTTTTTTLPSSPEPGDRWPAEQAYIVLEDDYPVIIADLYDISLDALREYNGWADDYSDFPDAGGTVRIPPDALYIDPAASTTTTTEEPATTDEPSETEASTETTAADPASCTPGEHTVQLNENPTVIAQKYDVTLEALTQANGWDVPDYTLFPPAGETIIIPPGAACTTTTVAPG